MPPYGIEKQNAARGALPFIKNGMTVGLGTGTTSAEFIRLLAAKIRQGLRVQCVATSTGSQRLAESLGIEIVPLTQIDRIDVAVDGADVATSRALLKGGGGALTREKTIEYAAKKFVVIADESKLKHRLEGVVVVEVLPFAYPLVLKTLHPLCPVAALRMDKNEPVITDNGNYLIDCPMRIAQPKKLERELNQIPGVVENGIFTQFHVLIIGQSNGYRLARK